MKAKRRKSSRGGPVFAAAAAALLLLLEPGVPVWSKRAPAPYTGVVRDPGGYCMLRNAPAKNENEKHRYPRQQGRTCASRVVSQTAIDACSGFDVMLETWPPHADS